MAILLGIDIGTSGVKTLLVDETGKVIASASEEYSLLTPHPSWAEQNPADWWDGTIKAVRALLEKSGINPSGIAAAGLSGQMHGLVPLDIDMNVIRPAILWCDQRTVDECDEIERLVGRERLVQTVSNPALTGFTAPKILWMQNEEFDNYSRTKIFLLPKDYIRFMLTGEAHIDISDASGTMLLDVKNGRWADDIITTINISHAIFPDIVGSEEICGKLTAEAARLTGLTEGMPVVGGGADNTCAAVGTGIVRAGRVSSSIGSSGVIFAHTDEHQVDPETRVHTFNHSVPGKFYLMGVMLSAGLSFKWFRDTFASVEMETEKSGGPDAYDALSKLAQTAPPAAEGLLFLPYLNGERTPHKDPYARGVFFGISPRHTRAHIVRSVMEGIVFGLKDSLDIMRGLGIEVTQVRATGGGGKNAFWRQMQADVFGAPVVTVNNDEGPAFGAALLAGVGAGIFPGVAEAAESTVKITSETTPDPEMTKIYSVAHKRFKELYGAVKDQFGKIDG